jgi:hypothetical protein
MLECLTGTRCYPGTVAETTMARLHRAPLVPVDLPSWLRHTLRAMTARDPRRRPPAAAVAEALRRRTIDAVLAPTDGIDLATLSTGAANHEITSSSETIESRTPRPPPPTRTARGPLALAFGGGALTTAALLAILALSLAIWPFTDNGAQATESPAAPTPTSTTTEPNPTTSTPSLTTPQTPTTLPTSPPAAKRHGANENAAEESNSGPGNDNVRGRVTATATVADDRPDGSAIAAWPGQPASSSGRCRVSRSARSKDRRRRRHRLAADARRHLRRTGHRHRRRRHHLAASVRGRRRGVPPHRRHLLGRALRPVHRPLRYRRGVAQHLRDVPHHEIVKAAAEAFGGTPSQEAR